MASSPPKMGGPVRGRSGEARRRDRGREEGGLLPLSVFSGVLRNRREENVASFEPRVSGGNRSGGNY